MGGGIFLGIRHDLYETVIMDNSDKTQFVTVRLTNKDLNVQIVLVYGPQESYPEDIRESFYHDVLSDMFNNYNMKLLNSSKL